jgi:hypothetical protein
LYAFSANDLSNGGTNDSARSFEFPNIVVSKSAFGEAGGHCDFVSLVGVKRLVEFADRNRQDSRADWLGRIEIDLGCTHLEEATERRREEADAFLEGLFELLSA